MVQCENYEDDSYLVTLKSYTTCFKTFGDDAAQNAYIKVSFAKHNMSWILIVATNDDIYSSNVRFNV